MFKNTPYNLRVENQNIIIELDKTMIDYEQLTKFLDYLELESIRKRSGLTLEAAANLADDIDQQVWYNIKHKLLG